MRCHTGVSKSKERIKNMDEINNIKLIVPEDCGNAPRKLILRDFNIAIITNKQDFLLDNIADNISWNIIGQSLVEGRDNFIGKINEINHNMVTKLEFYNIITHGYTASANGKLTLEEKIYDFCHVYRFTSAGKKAKIKEITSYIITRERT